MKASLRGLVGVAAILWSSTAGAWANTVHQLPGVPVAVPGSTTGSRSPKSRW